MVTVSLPEIPQGEYLEDYVATFLQCGGFYTEKSLIENGETQVMELDIMAWKPTDQPPQHALFEVKGGDWGFADIFKVYGWATYLQHRGVDAAYFIAPTGGKTEKKVEFAQMKCREIGLKLIVYDDLPALEKNLIELDLTPPTLNELDHAVWRFSFWLERQMQKVVTNDRKFQKDNHGPAQVYEYQELIRNGFLQARNVRERLTSLYEAHFDHKTLAKSVAAELDGSGWETHNPPNGIHWTEARNDCKHQLVQAATYHEHRARLGILKGAVEFALLQRHDALPPTGVLKILRTEIPADSLPSNFHSAVENLQTIDGFEKLVVIWQSFLWKWGRFFLINHESEEKATLAGEADMTAQAVDSVIDIYNMLFPISSEWFYEYQGAKVLKLFPCQFRGLGARYRGVRLNADDWKEVFSSLPYRHLLNNVIRWNNSAVGLLQYGA